MEHITIPLEDDDVNIVQFNREAMTFRVMLIEVSTILFSLYKRTVKTNSNQNLIALEADNIHQHLIIKQP